MKIKYKLLRLRPLDHGILVRVRGVPLDDKTGQPIVARDGTPIFHEIEEVIQNLQWAADVDGTPHTPESYAALAIKVHGWEARSVEYLTKVLRHNGLMKPKFDGVPTVDGSVDL